MNPAAMRMMVGLRYKLMWAKTRTRNGKIALFVVGYLLLTMVMVLFAAGGLGAAIIAVKSGKAELLSQAVLGGLFLQAVFGSVMLGFGMNAVFSEVELRRYPLALAERRIIRHLIGILDPFWFLILALELGLAIGLCVMGDFNIVMALAAVLLLFVCNYLFDRVISQGIDRIASRRSGSAVLMVFVMVLAFLPGVLMPVLIKNKANLAVLIGMLRWTPPFGAAAAMTQPMLHALPGVGLILWWLLGLTALLVYMEKHPVREAAAQTSIVKWESPWDRVGTIFGPRHAPLIAFWLRFYTRNNRFRALYGLTLPIVVFLTFNFRNGFGRKAQSGAVDPNSLFAAALGAIFVVGFFATSRFAVNQYGYAGGAFRRFFLLPTDPSASMRAGSWACMLVGSTLIPAALLLWAIFGGPLDIRKLAMLLGSALTGLFALHAAGLWVTLFGARKGSYTAAMGNDMSLMGNLVVIGGVLCALFTPQLLRKFLPAAVSPDNWWGTYLLAVCAFGFYVISLRATGVLFQSKREELLAVVEGRAT